MLYPREYYVFSIPVGLGSKAQCDGNGQSLAERWNAAAKLTEPAIFARIEH